MSKRIKSEAKPGLRTREEFERAVNAIAVLDTRIRLLEAKRDRALQEVQDARNPDILAAKEDQAKLLAEAEAYAEQHQGELFRPGTKSAETELATYGFRTHPPALALLNRKWSWEAVLERLRAKCPEWIRTKEEPDKDGIKANVPEADLADLGLKLTTKETFGVTPKTEAGERGVA